MLPATSSSGWAARLAYAAAACFTLASAGTNLIYGWGKGADLGSSLVWATVSAGVSIVFALSWPAFIRSFEERQWSRAVMVFVALLLTGAYSVSAALGSASGGRAAATTAEAATNDAREKAQAAWDAAKAEMDKLAAVNPAAELEQLIGDARAELERVSDARPVAVLEALIAAAEKCGAGAVRSVRVEAGSRKTTCRASAALTTELAKASTRDQLTAKIAALNADRGTAEQRHSERRERVQAAMNKAAADLATTKPGKQANSDAVALAAYLSGLGIEATPDRLNKLLALLAVLVIECGGGLALAVGMALGDAGRRQPVDRASVQSERSVSEQTAERPNATTERMAASAPAISTTERSPSPTEQPTKPAHERVLAALRARDGVLFGGQAALGRVFGGWSKTRTNEVLHELEAAGRIRLSISRQGTTVRLAAA